MRAASSPSLLHETRQFVVVGVSRLAGLEERVRVLRGAADLRPVGRQRALAMCLDSGIVDEQSADRRR